MTRKIIRVQLTESNAHSCIFIFLSQTRLWRRRFEAFDDMAFEMPRKATQQLAPDAASL
jgi:CRP-like cAMP-binding protein